MRDNRIEETTTKNTAALVALTPSRPSSRLTPSRIASRFNRPRSLIKHAPCRYRSTHIVLISAHPSAVIAYPHPTLYG